MDLRDHEARARLEREPIDPPHARGYFERRLARENGWSSRHAARVIVEYKRFLWLAVGQQQAVTPSEAVDQAWHLHITDTLEYRRFCDNALGRYLHHTPSRGEPDECARFAAQYARTLSLYRQVFDQDPPLDVWPKLPLRLRQPAEFVRVDLARCWTLPKPAWVGNLLASPRFRVLKRPEWIAIAVGLALLGCLTSIGEPPPLSGKTFLIGYVVAWTACLGVALCMRRGLFVSKLNDALELDPYEIAELAHPGRAIDGAVSTLIARRCVSLDPENGILRTLAPLPDGAHPVERRAYAEIAQAPELPLRELSPRLYDVTVDIAHRLEMLGLIAERPSPVPFWIALAAPIVGCARILTRAGSDLPMGILIALCVLGVLAAFVLFGDRPGRTPAGAARLAHLEKSHASLRTNRFGPEPASVDGLTLALGLFGFGVVAMPELQAWVSYRSAEARASAEFGGVCGAVRCGGASDGGGGGCGAGCGGGCGG